MYLDIRTAAHWLADYPNVLPSAERDDNYRPREFASLARSVKSVASTNSSIAGGSTAAAACTVESSLRQNGRTWLPNRESRSPVVSGNGVAFVLVRDTRILTIRDE